MDRKSTYRFSNLDGLRFIAAMFVVINHTEQISGVLGLDNYFSLKGIEQIGKFGVMLFFSLSGFLITYLLLKEKSTTGTINIKSFYMRRILRIWPLYIVIILLAFFVFHYIPIFDLKSGEKSIFYDHLWLKMLFYAFMLPNLVLLVFGAVPFASQTWSIGSEEQFYIIWPILLKRIKITALSLVGVIIVYHAFIYCFQNYVRSNIYREYCVALMQTVPLDLMALGGIVAYAHHSKGTVYQWLQKLTEKWVVKVVLFIALAILLITGYRFLYFNYMVYGLLFAGLIFMLTSGKSYSILENRLFKFGGKVSYGIYMWHAPAVAITLKTLLIVGIYSKFIAYPLIIAVVMGTAWLSYEYLEKPFLNWKQKYTVV